MCNNYLPLRQAVCDELEAQQPGLEKEYRRRRIQQQRLIEQAVRESAAAAAALHDRYSVLGCLALSLPHCHVFCLFFNKLRRLSEIYGRR